MSKFAGALSDQQYGFQRVHTTVDVIQKVLDLDRENLAFSKCCVVMTRDAKNAFNSVNCG